VPDTLPHDWFPAPLPAGVVVGEGSWVYSSFAFLHTRSARLPAVRIGRHSGVYDGCFFDLGPSGEVVVGDYTALVGVIFSTNGRVTIGDMCLFAHEVVIADDHLARPWDAALHPRPAERGDVVVGHNVWVGAGAVLLAGTHLGDDSIVGAGTVVDDEVPAGAIVAGNPARVVGRVRSGRVA
jgi:acetyltransferase-like isoleucine patch superfamily enzyme